MTAVSFSIARATKGLTTNTKAIEFIRESASTKTTKKPFSNTSRLQIGSFLWTGMKNGTKSQGI
jgi:hypothetical protein